MPPENDCCLEMFNLPHNFVRQKKLADRDSATTKEANAANKGKVIEQIAPNQNII